MDDKTYIGALAEAEVIAALTKLKFHVFNQVSGKAPFDLVAVRDNKLYRINVKGVSVGANKNGSYDLQLASVRSNKTANVIHKYDPTSCDILAVFILKENTICYFKSADIQSGRSIALRTKKSSHSRSCRLIAEHTDLDKIIWK
jgi:hypothetical protein